MERNTKDPQVVCAVNILLENKRKAKQMLGEMEELTGIKVKVGNDANVAALGEMWKGGSPVTAWPLLRRRQR